MTTSTEAPCNAWFAFASRTEPRVGFRVSYQPIVESIIDALASHLEAGFFPLKVDTPLADPVEDAASLVRSTEHRVAALTSEREHILSTISSGVLSEVLLRELDTKFRAITAQIDDANSRLNEARLEVQRARHVSDTLRARQSLDHLLTFVSSLRDPHSPVATLFFRSCVRNLAFQAHDLPNREREITWTGCIEFVAEDQVVTVPFTGSHTTLRPIAADRNWAVQQLLSGTPLGTDVATRRLTGTRPKVRPRDILPALDLDRSESWIIHVGDSLLLRSYLALYAHHPELPTWASLTDDIESDFGDPEEFESVLRRCYATTTCKKNPMWIHTRALKETQALIAAALGLPVTAETLPRNWVSPTTGIAEPWPVTDGLRNMPPCRHCAGHKRVRFAINEPRGYICLECRRDATGLTWPSRMDRFIAYPELWTAAGFSLDLPKPPRAPKPKRTKTDRKHRLNGLSTKEVLTILDAYRSGTALSSICERHHLRDAHDIYYLLDKHNIPRRRFL